MRRASAFTQNPKPQAQNKRAGAFFALTKLEQNNVIDALKMSEESPQSLSRELIVQNKMGIHARPAAMIVRIANKYPQVSLDVEKDDERVNGKSIMGLMMLAAGSGSKLNFIVEGDAEEATRLLDDLQALFERKFEEV